jgi:predicted GTPase
LENSFRDYFGFLGTPIKISFRKSDWVLLIRLT